MLTSGQAVKQTKKARYTGDRKKWLTCAKAAVRKMMFPVMHNCRVMD